MSNSHGDDYLSLFEDDHVNLSPEHNEWKILIVDDDENVHQATVLALTNTQLLGRNVCFLHAYSAKQAIECLKDNGDVAVVLIDFVMQRDNSGLQLVRAIREDLDLHDLRIILRTGQPGYVQEIEAIHDYDINVYQARLNHTRSYLCKTLTTALRAYEQIRVVNAGKRGLDQIIDASERMKSHQGLSEFATGIITEIAGLLQTEAEGFVCARGRSNVSGQIRLIAATGRFAPFVEQTLSTLSDLTLEARVFETFTEHRNRHDAESCTLFFASETGNNLVAYIETRRPLNEVSRRLLEVFCANIRVNFDNVQLFDQLHDHAYNDQLLHIPNRLAFMHAVSDAIHARRLSETIALVDIDHFSHINDALGYRYGDAMLKAVARRLVENLPESTVISRMTADTFGILGSDEVISPANLHALFHEPFVVEGAEQSLSATIGFARLSDIQGSGTEAVKLANIALNQAKNTSRGEGVYFTPAMEFETRARLRLLRELRSAFDEERLFVTYQPQYSLSTRQLIGVEALLRWRTDEGNFVSPNQFIPLAESSGLIVGLGKWVLRTACHDLKRLVDDGFKDLRMSVNVSVMQFRHPGFAETIDEVLAESRIDPRLLELEITESVAMLDAGFMLSTLNQLKERGISIAIDDFGTGFSSLSYLERLNVDRLKVDQSFIEQMGQADSSLRIVETIVQLGRTLQLQVIAEGVEHRAQAELLEHIGCHEAQGYLYAKPMTFRQLRAFLASPPPTRASLGNALNNGSCRVLPPETLGGYSRSQSNPAPSQGTAGND